VVAEGEALLATRHPGRGLRANQELWAAVLLAQLRVPRARMVEVFACARAVGWVAHVEEQVALDRVVRPIARYRGAS
jgi:citrate synthase